MILPSDVAVAMTRFAREAYPYECCGALLGSGMTVEMALPIANTSEEPKERRFRILPADYRRVEAQADRHGYELLGFYHSHPDHPARPSAYDLEQAWPNLTYIILSIESNRIDGITAWLLSEDRSRFEPVDLSILDQQRTANRTR